MHKNRRKSPARKAKARVKKPVAAAAAKRKGMTISDAATFVPSAPPELGRSRLQFPKLPRAVMGGETRDMYMGDPAAAKLAMDDAGPGGFPFGSFLNLNTVAGLSAFGLYFPGYPYLAELAQRSEFRQPTETIAKEMTRKWITFKSKGGGDKADAIKWIEEDFETYDVQALFRKVTEYDGFYGMGHLFVNLKGAAGASHELPLTIDEKGIEKGALLGFKAIEPMWTTPIAWNSTDPTHPNFYKADSWMVLGRRTSASRMLRFVSREVPDIIKPAYNFGGISLSQLIEPYVGRWLKTVDSVNRLINNFSVLFLQTDMAAILDAGGSGDLLKRLKLFTQNRDNQGIFATDKESENLNQLAVPLSGLSELQAQAQEHMAAPTHLPLVILTGITPAGLNASSDSEIEIFHDWNNAMQETLYTRHLKTVLQVIQLNRWGKVDRDIVFDYVQLKELDGEAASRVFKTKADAGVGYIDSGVILPEEERARLANDPESGYNNLSAAMPPELVELNEQKNAPPPPPGEEGDPDEDEEPAAEAA